jgi:uncharacterized membrane protein
MKAHLKYLVYTLNASFWFLPGLMMLAAIVLSFAMLWLDHALQDAAIDVSNWLYGASPQGARQLLTTIASSTITVTSLVFSMTLVALTLASQQLGPRLLENFMRNKANQLVIGYFVATFVYSLLVLRAVRDVAGSQFVPLCATATAIGLSIISSGVLIAFIHHVAKSIQADAVVADVSEHLDELIARQFAETDDRELAKLDGAWPDDFYERATPICASESGYIQTLDIPALKNLAIERNMILRLERRPGHFVVEGSPIAYFLAGTDGSREISKEINRGFVIGPKRTAAQDIEYEIRVIAEIAIRALSPGINDSYTAVTCVDRLTAVLASVMNRRFPPADFGDDRGRIVLRTVPPDFKGMLDAAFNDIRQSAQNNTAVTIRLLESLTVLAKMSMRDEHKDAIAKHMDMVGRAAAQFIFEPEDKSDAEKRLKETRRALAGNPQS